MEYIDAHETKSREATEADTDRILTDGENMLELCDNPPESYSKALAIAHSQITENDPLRFFVTNMGEVIINPVITRHTQVPILRKEGCTTFPISFNMVLMKRWNKCEVEYWTIEDEETLAWVKKTESLSGERSQMFQHEIDHMNGIHIYDHLLNNQ